MAVVITRIMQRAFPVEKPSPVSVPPVPCEAMVGRRTPTRSMQMATQRLVGTLVPKKACGPPALGDQELSGRPVNTGVVIGGLREDGSEDELGVGGDFIHGGSDLRHRGVLGQRSFDQDGSVSRSIASCVRHHLYHVKDELVIDHVEHGWHQVGGHLFWWYVKVPQSLLLDHDEVGQGYSQLDEFLETDISRDAVLVRHTRVTQLSEHVAERPGGDVHSDNQDGGQRRLLFTIFFHA